MDFSDIGLEVYIKGYLLALCRIAGVFFMAPFFSHPALPKRLRMIFSLFVAFIVSPLVTNKMIAEGGDYLMLIISEVFIGIIIGYIAKILFLIFQSSAQLYHAELGFGLMSVVDPFTQQEISPVGQLLSIFSIYIFIIINGPALIIKALYQSYQILPVFDFKDFDFIYKLIEIFSKSFIIAFKIALPMIGVLFLVIVLLGLLSKAAPMINIFVVGLQITTIVGFITFFFLIPILFKVGINIFSLTTEYITDLLTCIRFNQ